MTGRAVVAWSSGKDSAWMLHELAGDEAVEIAGLLTTLAPDLGVAMHAVRSPLVRAQAAALDLPLVEVEVPHGADNDLYGARFRDALGDLRAAGVDAVAFGDLHLADVRSWRQELLAGSGVEALFPLWGRPTRRLASRIVEAGIEAVVTCVDPERVPSELLGARYDRDLLAALPDDVDPCGEHGEFHTFVVAGPMFERPLAIEIGEVDERDGFLVREPRLVEE